MRRLQRRAQRLMVVSSVALGLFAAAPAAAHSEQPSPGAPSVGDRLFPGLGNGGYDVEHYTLDFTYATTASVADDPRGGDDRGARDAAAVAL